MAIPDFQSVMRPFLVEIQDGEVHKVNDVLESLSDYFNLTDEERTRLIDSGKMPVIKNRVWWARTYLVKAGLAISPGRGMVQIQDRGLAALQECPDKVDVKYLKKYEEFLEFHRPKKKADADNTSEEEDDSDEMTITPEEQLAKAHRTLTKTLASDIIESISACSPYFFERLVVELMIAMGYGGSLKEAGQATQLTGDEGIDGIIKEDKLGLDTIYLQAKRWKNTVHRPEIDKFIGALTRKGARKGVFITTSNFSEGCREAALTPNTSIVLIDGQELAELMIQHDLGVSVKETYQVKAIDSDYFNED